MVVKEPASLKSAVGGYARLHFRYFDDGGDGDLGMFDPTAHEAHVESLAAANPTGIYNFSPSMLKSLIQKNVRMQRADAAVRCASLLICKVSWIEFIRRLGIIIIEDAILHPAYPLVVWLTGAASKGHCPTRKHVNAALRVLHDVARVHVKDESFSRAALAQFLPGVDLPKLSMVDDTLWSLEDGERAIVKSLLVRAALGGMPGDVAMLRQSAFMWLHRLKGDIQNAHTVGDDVVVPGLFAPPSGSSCWMTYLDEVYGPNSGPPIALDVMTVGYVEPGDLLLTAFDFHCTPLIDRLLASDMKQVILSVLRAGLGFKVNVDAMLKTLIWEFRSSITTKTALIPTDTSAEDDEEERGGGGCGGAHARKMEVLRNLWHLIDSTIDEIAVSIIRRRITKNRS